MNYLALDYGISTVGLATAQTALAQPYGQIKNSSHKQTIEEVIKICQKEKIDQIIIGVSEGKMAEIIKEFAKTLKQKISLPVVLVDETLSSKEAISYLIQSGAKQKKRREKDHQIAAAIILQAYLDGQEGSLVY
jgi:putative Holliday junction resolvase